MIVPEGSPVPVGVTSLHKIDVFGSCSSGIVIWDQNWWGKGVASLAHLGRTLFAADYLNRLTITSSIRTVNTASFKAAVKNGYIITGVQPRSAFRQGRYLDTYNLTWLNPERIDILYPEGLPAEYREGVERARAALNKARAAVSWA